MEVCSGRFHEGHIWTIRGSRWRFAPDDFVKAFCLDDPGWHVEVSSGRFRKGFIWTTRASMWRSAPDDVVKVLS